MHILDKIVSAKRQEIELRKARTSEDVLAKSLGRAPALRDFRAALCHGLQTMPQQGDEVSVIAEIKKASPSAGLLRSDFDPVAIALIYERHGAAALSVLTDEPFFQGSLEHLSAVRAEVSLPLLRKDFILDRYQLLEARLAGADAILLIAEVLPGKELNRLLAEAKSLGLQALVELYDVSNLTRVIDSGAGLIGVNNRDLRTFVTRLEHTLDLASKVPPSCCLVSESGIHDRTDVLRLAAAGVKAILVGEALMKAPDIGLKLDELRGRDCPSLFTPPLRKGGQGGS